MLAHHQTLAHQDTSPLNGRTSPLEVNEILSHIFSFLSQSVLKYVVNRVSRRWLSVANALSHRHLVLSQNDVKALPKLKRRLLLANELTIGWAPRHWTQLLDDKQTKLWSKLMTAVVHGLSDIDSEARDIGSDNIERRGACFRRMNLNLEHWWYDQHVLLTFFHHTRLTHLSMDLPYSAGAVFMNIFLDQCPNLLSLSLTALKRSTPATSGDHAWLHHNTVLDSQDRNGVEMAQKPWPLQRLCLDALHVSPEALETYFPGLGKLKELNLLSVKIPKTGAPLSFDDEPTKLKFWTSLKASCPRLEVIHYSNECKLKSDLPVELFAGSKVHSWGIDSSPATMRLALTRLIAFQVENSLTTLEIIPGNAHEGSNPTQPVSVIDSKLREFLCCAPSLLHLKVRIGLTLNAFWESGMVNDVTSHWMCRGLKTLSLCLLFVRHNGPFIWSGHLFGYLSRMCPHLIELSLEVRGQVLAPESGWALSFDPDAGVEATGALYPISGKDQQQHVGESRLCVDPRRTWQSSSIRTVFLRSNAITFEPTRIVPSRFWSRLVFAGQSTSTPASSPRPRRLRGVLTQDTEKNRSLPRTGNASWKKWFYN